ncbi:MAG: hypothetical protein GX801_04980 [Fibrobacter sp.]|nr:hypothetical protein [Fibrobacter sp.]
MRTINIVIFTLLAFYQVWACPFHDPELPTWNPLGEDIFVLSTFLEKKNGEFYPGVSWPTNEKEGWPVQTPEAGEVIELRESPYDYGKALVLQGVSGHQWVFAHLSSFSPALDSAFEAKKHLKKSNELKWQPPQTTWTKFNEYDTIGYSGQTGTSEPNLLLEMRGARGKTILNPCFYGIACDDSVYIKLVGAAVWDAANPKSNLSLTSEAALKKGCLEVDPSFIEPRLALKFLDYTHKSSTKPTGIYELNMQVGDKMVFAKEYQQLGISQKDVIFEEILWAENQKSPGEWHVMAPGTRPNPSTEGSARTLSQFMRNVVRYNDRRAKSHPVKLNVMDYRYNESYFALVPREKCSPTYNHSLYHHQDSLLFTFLSRPWLNLKVCVQSDAKVSILDENKHILSNEICQEFPHEAIQLSAILQKFPQGRTLTVSANQNSRAIAVRPVRLSPNQKISWFQDGVQLEFTHHRPLFPTALAWELQNDKKGQALRVHPKGFYTTGKVKTCMRPDDSQAQLYRLNADTQKWEWLATQNSSTINGQKYLCATTSELQDLSFRIDKTPPKLGTPQNTIISEKGKDIPAWRIPLHENGAGIASGNDLQAWQGETWVPLRYQAHSSEIIIKKRHLKKGVPLRVEMRDAVGNKSTANLKL